MVVKEILKLFFMTQKQTATIDHPPQKCRNCRNGATCVQRQFDVQCCGVADVAAVSGRGQKKLAVVENLPQSVARKISPASACSNMNSRSR